MKQWFVAYTQPCKEYTAQENLMQQGFKTYLPLYKRLRRHARKVDTILSPLFPRYIFVELDVKRDSWRCINGTHGVIYLLMIENKPTAISTFIIDQLQLQEDTEGTVPLSSIAMFDQGQSVYIKEGVFSGYTAIFEKMDDKQRVKLLLNFLGREQTIQLPFYAVEAA